MLLKGFLLIKNKIKVISIGFEKDIIFEITRNNKYVYEGYVSNENLNNNFNFFCNFNTLKKMISKYSELLIIISIGPPNIRKSIYSNYKKNLLTYVSPDAIVSKKAIIGKGTFVQSRSFISDDVKIGKCCKINGGSHFCHDSSLGDFSDTSPSCFIGGNTKIGSEVYIGANTSIRQNLKINDNILIGMGSVVINNLDREGVYVGSPAIYKKSR